MSDESNCSELLGQKICYPSSWQAVVGLLAVILGICIIVYIALVPAKPENLQNVLGFTAKIYSSEGEKIDTDSYLIGFWTPSENTKNFKTLSNVNNWELLPDNEKVIGFGEKLVGVNEILGYRRYRVYGEGSNGPKEGWWWVMRVKEEFSTDQFVGIYRGFWSGDAAVYMEVTGYGGKYH